MTNVQGHVIFDAANIVSSVSWLVIECTRLHLILSRVVRFDQGFKVISAASRCKCNNKIALQKEFWNKYIQQTSAYVLLIRYDAAMFYCLPTIYYSISHRLIRGYFPDQVSLLFGTLIIHTLYYEDIHTHVIIDRWRCRSQNWRHLCYI